MLFRKRKVKPYNPTPAPRENNMDLNTYQTRAFYFAEYNDSLYPVLGLCEEAGEVTKWFAKAARGDKEVDVDAVTKELGDVMWMVSAIAAELGLKLGDIAEANINKLMDRKKRGVVRGDGDNR